MGGKVVASDVGAQASGKGLQGREIPHIQGGHPLVLHGPEPPLYLGLGCRGIGFAVIDGGSDAGGQQFHLFVLIGAAVIEIEHPGHAVLCHSAFHHGHEVYEGILEEHPCPGDKAACVIDQGDHIYPAFPAVCCPEVRPDAGIPAPDFVHMGAFIAPHILDGRTSCFQGEPVHIPVHSGLGDFAAFYAAVLL